MPPAGPGEAMERAPSRPAGALALAGVLVPFMLSAYSVFSLSLVLGQLARQFSVPASAVLAAIPIDFVGGAVGGVLLGYMADRLGRRPALMLAVALFGLAVLAASAINSLWELYVLWFLVGVGVNSQNGVAYAVLVELLRSAKGSVGGFMQGLYFIGFFLDELVHVLVPHWRPYFLVVGASSLAVSLALTSQVPETSAGRRAPGASLLRMGRRLALVTVGLSAVVVGAFMYSVPLLSVVPSFLGSMGLGQRVLFGLSLAGFAGFVAAGAASDAYGRLGTQVAFSAAGLASSVLLALAASGGAGLAALVALFFFTGYFGFTGIWAGESYPAEFRATATNVVFLVGRLVGGFSAIIAALAYPPSLRVGTAITCAVANALALVGAAIYYEARRL